MKKILLLSSMLIAAGCGDKEEEKKGKAIGAPEIKPPVERNIPAGFGTTLRLDDAEVTTTPKERAIEAITKYLKPGDDDAVGALERLEAIDNRMSELNTRSRDSSPRKCLEETAKDYTLAGDLPGSNSIALKFQCQENLDGGSGAANEAQLAFGIDDSNFYLFERTGSHDNAVLAIAPVDGKKADVWQIGNNESPSFIHLIAEDDVGLEFTAASDGSGSDGLACGVHMKSDKNLIYVKGYFPSTGTCDEDPIEFCLKASDLSEEELTVCTDSDVSNFSIPTLTTAQVKVIEESADDIITTPITGFVGFNEEASE